MPFSLGQDVKIKDSQLTGRVIGHGHAYQSYVGCYEQATHIVIVQLDVHCRAWLEGRESYITVMAVNEENLTSVEDGV